MSRHYVADSLEWTCPLDSWVADATGSQDGACSPDNSGATRMQDEAGYAPADRRWSDVRSDARDDRLQISDVEWIAAMVDGVVKLRLVQAAQNTLVWVRA